MDRLRRGAHSNVPWTVSGLKAGVTPGFTHEHHLALAFFAGCASDKTLQVEHFSGWRPSAMPQLAGHPAVREIRTRVLPPATPGR